MKKGLMEIALEEKERRQQWWAHVITHNIQWDIQWVIQWVIPDYREHRAQLHLSLLLAHYAPEEATDMYFQYLEWLSQKMVGFITGGGRKNRDN